MSGLAGDSQSLELLWQSLDLPGSIFKYARGLQPLRFERLRDLLGRLSYKLAVAEFFPYPDQILVFIIRSDESQPILMECPCTEAGFAYLMTTYNREILEYPRYGTDIRWQELATRILERVMPTLQGAELVCLIPHHDFSYLPLHTLQSNGRYLIDQFPIVYSPSASILMRTLERLVIDDATRSLQRILVVGNPTFDLEYTEEEAQSVANYFDVHPYLGREATKVKIRSQLAGQDLIHLACHGFFHVNDPLESGLLMAGKRVLNLNDIKAVQIHADLVTLSCCESSLISTYLPGEANGLPVAFLDSGALSVMGTLWRVADESTTLLINDFYRRLYDRAGNKINTKANALQQAMLALREQKEHPYYWAAFTLTGSWQ